MRRIARILPRPPAWPELREGWVCRRLYGQDRLALYWNACERTDRAVLLQLVLYLGCREISTSKGLLQFLLPLVFNIQSALSRTGGDLSTTTSA